MSRKDNDPMSSTETKLTVEELDRWFGMQARDLELEIKIYDYCRSSIEANGAWEPIETAEKTGEARLLLLSGNRVVMGFWGWGGVHAQGENTWREGCRWRPVKPTHWAPLPRPFPPAPSTGTGRLTQEQMDELCKPLGKQEFISGEELDRALQGRDVGDAKAGSGFDRSYFPESDAAEGDETCSHGRPLHQDCFACSEAPNVSPHEQERKHEVSASPQQQGRASGATWQDSGTGTPTSKETRLEISPQETLTPTDRETISELVGRAYEVIHHTAGCPAIGGRGDAFCLCDAVPVTNDLENAFSRLLNERACRTPIPTRRRQGGQQVNLFILGMIAGIAFSIAVIVVIVLLEGSKP